MKKHARKHRSRPNQKLARDRRPRPRRRQRPGEAPPLPVRGKTIHLARPGQFVTACGQWIDRKAHRLPTSDDRRVVTCANCRPELKASDRRIG